MYQAGSSSDWNSGKQLMGVVPQLDLSAEEVTLMNQGACGAFVHALEDEFKEVRLAAVQSMESLSTKNKEFGSMCLDHLIDMFNDEIEDVRILSISSIRKIMSHISLRDDQLDMVLGSLKDVSAAMRHSLHSLLSRSKIPSIKGMQSTTSALLENLTKYNTDKTSVWKCLRDLGRSHSELIAALVPSLLSTHPFLMTSEPNITDPAYICILILVFNACASCPTIPPLFPSHVYRHYLHLRDLLPDLVPDLKLPGEGTPTFTINPNREESNAFLCRMLEKTQFALTLSSPVSAQDLLQACIRDLTHVAGMDSKLRPSALFSVMFRQCQLFLLKISQFVKPAKAVNLHSEVGSQVTNSIEMVEKLSYKMEHMFCGLSDETRGKLCLLRMIAESVALLLVVKKGREIEQGMISDCVLAYSAQVHHLQTIFSKSGQPTPFCIDKIRAKLAEFTSDNSAKLENAIFSALESFKSLTLEEKDVKNLRMLSVVVLEPQPRAHTSPLKFLASLALSLRVHLKAFNFEDLSSLAVQATMPDGEEMLFRPKPSDWHSSELNEDTLQMSIVLSHGPWTDALCVHIGIVQVYTCDSSETKYQSVFQCVQELISKPKVKVEMGTCTNVGIISLTDIDSLEHSTISLCNPVPLYIHPLPEQGK
jgi:integrator complex subunit 4